MKLLFFILFLVGTLGAEQLDDLSALQTQLDAQDASLHLAESSETVPEVNQEEEQPVLAEADSAVSAEAAAWAEVDERTKNLAEQLEAYKSAIAELKAKITSSEQTVMDELAAVDVCPAGQVGNLLARAKRDIQALQRVQALYVALRQQEAQLAALLAQRGIKTAPVAAKGPAPAARRALQRAIKHVAGPRRLPHRRPARRVPRAGASRRVARRVVRPRAAPRRAVRARAAARAPRAQRARRAPRKAAPRKPITAAHNLKDVNNNMREALRRIAAFAGRLNKAEANIRTNAVKIGRGAATVAGQNSRLNKIEARLNQIGAQLAKLVNKVAPAAARKVVSVAKKAASAPKKANAVKARAIPHIAKKAAVRAAVRAAAKKAKIATKLARKVAVKKAKVAAKVAKKARTAVPKAKSKAIVRCTGKKAQRKCTVVGAAKVSKKARRVALAKKARRVVLAKKARRVVLAKKARRAALAKKARRAALTKKARRAAPNSSAKKAGRVARRATKKARRVAARTVVRCTGKKQQRRCRRFAVRGVAKKARRAAPRTVVRCTGKKARRVCRRIAVRTVVRCTGKKARRVCRRIAVANQIRRAPRTVVRCTGKKQRRVCRRIVVKTVVRCFGKKQKRVCRRVTVAVNPANRRRVNRQRRVLAATKRSALAASRAAAAARRAIQRAKNASKAAAAKAMAKAKAAAARAAATRKTLKKNLAKAKALKPATPIQKEKWSEIVRQSRVLLKRTVKIKDVLQRQLAQYQDESDVEGRKFNGWASIWDHLKGIKPAKHWANRAREIDKDVVTIMSPAESEAAAKSAYGGVVRVLKAADDTFATKYTRKLGNPALNLLLNGPTVDEFASPPTGARVKMISHDPTKPKGPELATGVNWKDLKQIPELGSSYSPIYVSMMKKGMEDRTPEKPEIPAYDPVWRHKRVPYTYPVRIVETNPKQSNPHFKTKKALAALPKLPETYTPSKRTPGAGARSRHVVTKFVDHDPRANAPTMKAAHASHIEPEYRDHA